jgi:hypothetical protein
MEGCQHNTTDVDYFGPSGWIQSWYLGALRASEEMARHLREDDFADICRRLYERGREWTDTHLFNGEYYEQDIRPPLTLRRVPPFLTVIPRNEKRDLAEPPWQLGAACLADQTVGQCMARVCGLGDILDRRRQRRALRSVMTYNFKSDLHGYFNHMRSFALNDESCVVVGTWPRGRRPKRPFPRDAELWTGLEYTAAVHMLYEGQVQNALRIFNAVRARHDGARRNPFDEPECGHHYARAMASWGAIPAWTGFHYSGIRGAMRVSCIHGSMFWSNGDAWGTIRQMPAPDGSMRVELTVLHGSVRLSHFAVAGVGSKVLDPPCTAKAGKAVRFRFSAPTSRR